MGELSIVLESELNRVFVDDTGITASYQINVEADVSWVGYANAGLRDAVQPVLQAALRTRGWIA